jgi:formylglycine-generating enzyme required for sulfatase activity
MAKRTKKRDTTSDGGELIAGVPLRPVQEFLCGHEHSEWFDFDRFDARRLARDQDEPVRSRTLQRDELKKQQAERAQQATSAAKKKADDDARAKAEAERQRVAILQRQEAEAAAKKRAEATGTAGPGQVFRDCPGCPEMVVVPAGSFTIGSPSNEPERRDNEGQLPVTIRKPFAVGRFAVTRGEFAAFVTATGQQRTEGGCLASTGSEWKGQVDRNWRSPGFTQTDRHPVVCVSWNDAKAYVAWLSSTTGKAYRLLSETEREYVARAGTTTPFWWGSSITPSQANYDGTLEPYTGGGSKGEYRKATVAVDTFAANAWGLYNVHGNVWEWTEDCWNERNAGNPGNADASGYCDRPLRGGAWDSDPGLLRSAYLPVTC